MWQVGPACYSSPLAAASAAASSQLGAVVVHGSTAYVIDVSSVSGSSIEYALTPVGGGSAITVSSPFTAQECGLLTASDGLVMGWGVAAAWLGAFALLFLTKGLRSDGYS